MAIPISGQKTVTTAGNAVALGDQIVGYSMLIKAHLANTSNIYVGNNGASDVDSGNGYILSPGEVCLFEYVGNLSAIYIDSAVNGEGVSWLILGA